MPPFSSLRRTLTACVVAVASVVVAATGVVGNAGASTNLARQIAAKGYTVVSLAGYANPGERGKNTLILSTQRATNFAAALHTALVTLGDHNVVITAVGKGGTTKFGKVTAAGGSPKNRIVTYTLGN